MQTKHLFCSTWLIPSIRTVGPSLILIYFDTINKHCYTLINPITLCSACDWDRIRITWGNPQSGCTDICSYSKRATVGVRAPYATRQNSGMKRIKCG